jgi:predicted ATPase/class 3 adenylate cyclase
MHRLMPDFVLDNYAAGITSGEFPAAALFVDVTGFSAMTDALMQHGQHGAEVLATVMRAALAPLILSVVEQEGFIAIQAGDAFTAIFVLDDPDQDPSRALAAAWNIQRRAAQQPIHHTPYGDFPVSVKVGGSLGQVAWGILQSESGGQAAYYFRGGVIDSSAEAEHNATAGQIILDAEFYGRVRGRVSAEAAGSFHRLTGLSGDLPTHLPFTVKEQNAALLKRFFAGDLHAQRHLGEFRQVVYLFVGIEGVHDEGGLDRFMQHVFNLQARYGGLLSVHFGDKGAHLMLLWGAPTAHENDIQRALNFVLDLRERAGGELRAGLTYRIAHAGFIGSDLAEQYAAYGRGPNLASRFMQAAPPGSIWVDEYIAQRTQQSFELDDMGAHNFRGFATPVKVYALRWRKEHSETFFSGALIGRQPELDRLAGFVRPILDGRYAGLVLVRGEPGMGKSRLVYEFVQRLHEDRPGRVQDFLAQTDEILREALNPFVYWLRRYFEISSSEPEDANREHFTRKLDGLIAETSSQRLAGELDRTRSFLAALLGLHWPDSLYEQLDAQGRHENTLICMTTLLQAESLQRPVVFVLEDAHWLDPASSEYLGRLTRAMTADERVQYPLVILATVRSGEVSPLLQELATASLDLEVLDHAGLAALAAAQLGSPASQRLAALLTIHSEGNPFFAEQILRYLKEQNLLVESETGWDLGGEYVASLLPLDVSAVLTARLDRLARDVKEAVQTAAILGREFEVRLLSHMLMGAATGLSAPHSDEEVRQVITHAEAEAIWAAIDELRYIFRHALLRDTAYQMQIEARRQELHGVAVTALETIYQDEIPLHYAELAYHADRAALTDKARDYYSKAGDVAAEAYQNAQAIEYYSRALALTPADDRLSRYELLIGREKVLETVGDREKRLRDLQELDSLTRPFDDTPRMANVALRRARYTYDGGDFLATIGFSEHTIALAEQLGLWEVALPAYALIAGALNRSGQPQRAREQAEAGLELARKFGDALTQSMLLNHLGLIYHEQGRADLAGASFDKSLELAHQTEDLRAQTHPLTNLALVAVALGDFPAAQRMYEASLAIWRKIGLRQDEATDLINLGWVAGNMGEYAKARSYLERHLRLARELGDLYGETYGALNLSGTLAALGDNAGANQQAEQALVLARKMGDRSAEAWALTYLGHSELALGQHERAAESYRQALNIRRELAQPTLATEPLAGLARAALIADDIISAKRHANEILDFLENSGSLAGTDDPLRVYYSGYLVLTSAEDPRATSLLQVAHAQLMERAEKIQDPEIQGGFLSNIEINRLIREAWEKSGGN